MTKCKGPQYDFTTFTTFTTFNHDLRSRSPRLEGSRLKWGEGGVKIAENLSFGTFRTLVMARARRPPPPNRTRRGA